MTVAGFASGALGPKGFLNNPAGVQAVRPNTPVLPFGSTLSAASFIDPSVTIVNGKHTVVGTQSYVAPYAVLNSQTGFIKIGGKSDILANAQIISNPNRLTHYPTSVLIGDQVSIGPGATILGPSKIGVYGTSAKNTGIGPNAVIDGATIQPGAIVGGLARVGPGVIIHTGMYVIPGSNVTTEAQATNPALGMVEAIPAASTTALASNITRYPALAAGYTFLYQGNSATGANPGSSSSTVYNGNLTLVEGASPEPGNATTTATTGIAFETTTTNPAEPSFLGPYKPSVMANLFNFKARIIGGVSFGERPAVVAAYIGQGDVILGDQGQPIKFKTDPYLGNNVTIGSPGGGITTTTTTTTTYGVSKTTTTTKSTGAMTFGTNFAAGDHSVILGGTAASYTIGNDVTIGSGAVVTNSSIGTGVTIGARAYVSGTTLPAGSRIPAGEIVINGKDLGQIQF